MSTKYIIAHDIGTSGNKASLFSSDGKLLCSVTEPYPVAWLAHNQAEQNPEDWYRAVCITTQNLLQNISPQEIAGLSFSGQMMGCVCVDRSGMPLMDAIIWADSRAQAEEQYIASQVDPEDFYRTTGHRVGSSYTLAKILWLKDHRRDVYDNTYKVLNAKDYIVYKLTGNFCTDYSDASGTNIFDINTREWASTIADSLDFDLGKMPDLQQSTAVVGGITELAARETGLRPSTPVVMGGGDGAISAIGAMAIREGAMFTSLGTSAWNALSSRKPLYDPQMRICNFAHAIPEMYLPCGTMQAAGLSIRWAERELYCGQDFYSEIESLLNDTPLGANGVIFSPYLVGERSPRWDMQVRGSFVGLKVSNSRADMIRAVYEGILFNLAIIRDIFAECYDGIIDATTLTGGGARNRVWCQMLADVYGMEARTPSQLEEATSIGAAITAGIGLGIYKNYQVIEEFSEINSAYLPVRSNTERYLELIKVFDRIYFSLQNIYFEE